jgi:hypothetical protein
MESKRLLAHAFEKKKASYFSINPCLIRLGLIDESYCVRVIHKYIVSSGLKHCFITWLNSAMSFTVRLRATHSSVRLRAMSSWQYPKSIGMNTT